ncbi:MAG TPA: ABC transporter ATP-binding protein [Ignavibacteria bacterium]|nr:ABC transporter ATP-binding protein [Ignavibacteria bacterium]
MSDIAIKVNDVSKAYLIGLSEVKHETLGGTLFSWLKSPSKNYNVLKRLNTFKHNYETEDLFWALKNISFELKHGETLGIVGKNGAGKSTLLKILSRITSPTSGYAEVYGRVASLLEVGTGFNAELTGRENVYLNGTILGMKKKEIDKKFDEIVDFSGIEKFIDTQVKKYSTGMRIRLAFSVAANIDTEVMIIDEVLSVGDAEFQKKSVAKMGQISKNGTAVILVTHNMLPIQSLCKKCIFLQNGKMTNYGVTDDIVSEYLGLVNRDKTSQSWSFEEAPSSDSIKLIKAEVRGLTNMPVIRAGESFEFEFEFYSLLEDEFDMTVTFHLLDEYENLVFISSTALTNLPFKASKGFFKTFCRIPENLLNNGKFTISKLLILKDTSIILYEHTDLLTFEITNDITYEHGQNGKIEGLLKPKLDWELKINGKN